MLNCSHLLGINDSGNWDKAPAVELAAHLTYLMLDVLGDIVKVADLPWSMPIRWSRKGIR